MRQNCTYIAHWCLSRCEWQLCNGLNLGVGECLMWRMLVEWMWISVEFRWLIAWCARTVHVLLTGVYKEVWVAAMRWIQSWHWRMPSAMHVSWVEVNRCRYYAKKWCCHYFLDAVASSQQSKQFSVQQQIMFINSSWQISFQFAASLIAFWFHCYLSTRWITQKMLRPEVNRSYFRWVLITNFNVWSWCITRHFTSNTKHRKSPKDTKSGKANYFIVVWSY